MQQGDKMGLFNFTIENSTSTSEPWINGNQYWSSFELYPDRKGSQLYVFRGSAYVGMDYLSEEEVVVKTFRRLAGQTADWEGHEKSAIKARALSFIFNRLLKDFGSTLQVRFNKPTHALMDAISDVMVLTRIFKGFQKTFQKQECVQVERFISGEFQTFVNEQGKACSNGASVLEAFCHYSFDQSGGELVVCNLKGVAEEGIFTLTCPVVHSRQGDFGDRDKGEAGISEFFRNHVCSSYCKGFLKPDTDLPSHPQPSAPPPYDLSEDTVTKATDGSCIGCTFPASADIHSVPVKFVAPPPYEECLKT